MQGNNYRALLGGVLVALALAVVSLQAALQVTLTTTSITAGASATVNLRADAGAAVTVSATGAADIPATTATVPAGGTVAVQIGPFAQPGEYQIAAVAGSERATATLRVEWPRGSGPATPRQPGALGNAVMGAMQASQQALNDASSGDWPHPVANLAAQTR